MLITFFAKSKKTGMSFKEWNLMFEVGKDCIGFSFLSLTAGTYYQKNDEVSYKNGKKSTVSRQ